MPKEGSQYICLSMILINSVIKTDKCIIKHNEISSDESDEEKSDKENSDKEIFDE